MSHPFDGIDFCDRPDLYRIGRGEQGIFHVEPYKSELLPLWTIRSQEEARSAADAIYDRYLNYRGCEDFVGMDMARKFLQMGYTRARRYANYKGGSKKNPYGSGEPRKAEIAEIFLARWQQVKDDKRYQQLKQRHRQQWEQ